VTFTTETISGGLSLHYRDAQRNLDFRGRDITVQETALGELITVTLETIPDLRTVTFTLILPIVTVRFQGQALRITVPGVTTTNPTTIAGPPPGPQKLYTVVNLRGTAQAIVS